MTNLLTIENLAVDFETRNGTVNAVRNLAFEVKRGRKLGIVGESGSGKSVTAFAIMRLLDSGGKIIDGELNYQGVDIRRCSEKEMRDIRGREISMVFQNPRAALNPIRTVGNQLVDVLRQHSLASGQGARRKAIDSLAAVKINDPESCFKRYPFELSGGMCQRVVIAIALACSPQLLIADEPTTGLDITTQKSVMELIDDLITDRQMSALFITHDLALAAQYCDSIIVMKDGEIVESGDPQGLFGLPQHPYTQKLVNATPRPGASLSDLLPPTPVGVSVAATPVAIVSDKPLLEVKNLSKVFNGGKAPFVAVNNISFTINENESVGLVGESGCGKSTTSNILMRLLTNTSGQILFDGRDFLDTGLRDFSKDSRRASLQMVFQDAGESLNPRHTAHKLIREPIARLTNLSRQKISARIEELAELVGLPRPLLTRFPHQLSGGQKARVGIARAIALNPKLLILDEPTAALDVSIQAIVLNLLADLRSRMKISYLFVSHDLRVVDLMCDRVLVMRQGEIIEHGGVDQIMNDPQHPYTMELLAAAPVPPVINGFPDGALSDKVLVGGC